MSRVYDEYLEKSFRRLGYDADINELEDMSKVLCNLNAVDVAEIFSPRRFTAKARGYGLRPGFAIDLTTQNGAGEFWDLSLEKHQEELDVLQEKERPEFLTGSPPCSDFCKLLRLLLTKAEIQKRQEEIGKPFVRTCVNSSSMVVISCTSIQGTRILGRWRKSRSWRRTQESTRLLGLCVAG